MHRPVEADVWQGRVDPEEAAVRWHQKVAPLTPEAIDTGEPGVVLLGVCSDVGVQRNFGRPGAENGPDAIRRALSNQAWHLDRPCYDAGNLHCVGDDLEALQEEQAVWVARLLDLGHLPLLLGGGHEIALGTYRGLRDHLERAGKRGVIGIINFDAHFDLRKSGSSTSGTPFLQIADSAGAKNLAFRYLCLGISETANTAFLFQTATALGAQWLCDEELVPWQVTLAEERLRSFLKGCDFVHLSIDLDVFPAAVAPGVSAPSPRGVSLEVAEYLLRAIKSQGGSKLKVVEIAECNPSFDNDGRTAKLAARLCHLVARTERKPDAKTS